MNPSQYVNPLIGTISHLLKSTKPEVMLPHRYPKSYPVFDSNTDYYCNEIIKGLPMGLTLILPGSETAKAACDFYLTVDHSREEAHPYGSTLEFDDSDIIVHSTVSEHTYVYKFINSRRIMVQAPENSEININGQRIYVRSKGDKQKRQFENEYLIITSNKPFNVIISEETFAVVEYAEDEIEFYGSLSFVSFDKADEIYHREIKDKTFDDIKESAMAVWDALLSKIKVWDDGGGDRSGKYRAFYTAMYRAFQRMVDYGEFGSYFSGYDDSVHDGDFFYTNDHIWDTFRCMHPLQLLLEPERQADILESYNLMYRQSGVMPSNPNVGGDLPVMLGFHAAALFADAMAKGLELDYKTAYEGIRENATEQTMLPWVCNTTTTELDRCYYEKGFFPALRPGESETVTEVHPHEKRQSVSVTLEHSYDDWCAAQIAKKLGRQSDYELFMKRSQNYRNLYNPETEIMQPKDKDGNWIECDPMWGGGRGGREYYTENNALVYLWSVFHDFDGLKALLGGDLEMEAKLDRLFTQGVNKNGKLISKYNFLYQFPDATGLMGMFPMGNEPSFHIPYLYNLCGVPWKAQKRLRELMDIWFTDSQTGICGDEDGGAMSSFFVFSAIGFYPVCPGKPEYLIGTPIFDNVEIDVGNGKTFCIKANGASSGHRYIQSAVLNGKVHNTPVLKHSDIVSGGELIINMGNKPNKEWGVL